MKEKKTGDYIAAAVFNVIFLVFVNTLPLWLEHTRGVVLASWVDVLWAMNIAIGVQIAGNLFLVFYRPAWLSKLMEAVFSAAGLLSVIVFFIVFPLDFSRLVGPWLNTVLKVLLMLGMAGSVIGIVVHLVKFSGAAGRAVSSAS